ncbi:MAG: nitroreductase [Acidobacteria bacterium 13_2_20CM_2_57_6]|nr:MAG: nitroreductase [Acidobacteria bacterium 13_2_20CM_57_7]OLB88357.1 MAG: nitroreductase [Acidobacteria bacterium 13_2_20CM_2_57_6]PYT39043.1 MAG: nitroreductase [Acidobacteriota bacterium]PYT43438.1 MAG: nitroreductase [Acidobacteriota bacterium]
MQKPAPSDFPVHELIRDRWSPRAFADKLVPQDVLRSIFEAARWAPSSFNEQPWAYIVATKDEKDNFEKILSVLVEFNAQWANGAPVLGLAVAKLAFANNNAPNRNAQYDTGAATALLSVEATARGLAVHQMAGFDPEKARQVFGIPAGWAPIAAVAIGYPGDPASLPPPLKDRELAPRTRKSIAEFVMAGKWGHTASFAAK